MTDVAEGCGWPIFIGSFI